MINIKDLWNEIMLTLETQMSAVSFEVWIKTLEPLCIAGHQLVLLAPSVSAKNLINKNYKNIISASTTQYNSTLSGAVIIIAEEKDFYLGLQNEEDKNSDPKPDEITESVFNQKYTFSSFVIGKSNEFAYAAAAAVADAPGEKYNPLFIYGGVGLGKTHLMHAIGNKIRETRPNLRILYVPTEQFTNELVDAVRNSSDRDFNREFREKYRNVDVLMLDDIQFISGKNGTQEAIFHTFNDLFQNNKQIVISSDRPPKEISKLEERLRTRFEWGLTADIQIPNFETRVAILKNKALSHNIVIEKDVLELIAEKVETNIREMEGLLSKVVFFASLLGKNTVTLDIAYEALKDHLEKNKAYVLNTDTIINAVCEYFKLTKADICSKKKTKDLVEPRMICIYLITDILDIPLVTIGEAIGGRDHTTIMHSRDKIAEELKTNERIKMIVKDLRSRILKT